MMNKLIRPTSMRVKKKINEASQRKAYPIKNTFLMLTLALLPTSIHTQPLAVRSGPQPCPTDSGIVGYVDLHSLQSDLSLAYMYQGSKGSRENAYILCPRTVFSFANSSPTQAIQYEAHEEILQHFGMEEQEFYYQQNEEMFDFMELVVHEWRVDPKVRNGEVFNEDALFSDLARFISSEHESQLEDFIDALQITEFDIDEIEMDTIQTSTNRRQIIRPSNEHNATPAPKLKPQTISIQCGFDGSPTSACVFEKKEEFLLALGHLSDVLVTGVTFVSTDSEPMLHFERKRNITYIDCIEDTHQRSLFRGGLRI